MSACGEYPVAYQTGVDWLKLVMVFLLAFDNQWGHNP